MIDKEINPITRADFPDPDVIRVEDTYYMISTTMHFMPGGVILRSYDLVNWEIAAHIFDKLDDTPAERLELEQSNYAGGMWAASLRYHNGTFYAAFVSHFAEKTYLFTAKNVTDTWEKSEIKGYYHDNSILFDDDGRVFIVWGNREIKLLELEPDLSGPKEGGISKTLLVDKSEGLGYEGSHFYKINGKYYLFLIHWPKGKRRTESCFVCDTVDGDYVGRDIFDDDRGYCNMGVAQGGIVDTPSGKWYAVLFQDSGAVGRIPVLVPLKWDKGFPVLGTSGKVPKHFEVASSRPYYRYEPLFTSDRFEYDVSKTSTPKLKEQWEWNHQPDDSLWKILPEGGLSITTGKLCANLSHAVNTLTQRTMYPRCEAEVTIDASDINEGDVAGLCILQGKYGYLGITRQTGGYFLIKVVREETGSSGIGVGGDYLPGKMVEVERLASPIVSLCLKASFENMADKLDFFYQKDGKWVKAGDSHKLEFRLDHFTGARFGLFMYSTKKTGGSATFTKFDYRYND